MRPRTLLPLVSIVLAAMCGCDLVSDMDGPQPEDFEVEDDTSEARATDEPDHIHQGELRHEVASPLAAARGGVTLSLDAHAGSADE